jgi:putative DNA primase/helicase
VEAHERNQFVGVGESDEGERFLKIAVGNRTALLSVDNIAAPNSAELKILTRIGQPLIKPISKSEFLARAHDAARQEPSFKVVTKTGWCGGVFVLPHGQSTAGKLNIEHYFDPLYRQYHKRLHPSGTPTGWLKLARLCRGKTRLIAALCQGFTAPVCAAFGFEPPGLQFVSIGGRGMTTIGRVGATVWGGDRNPARKLGCGVSWNNTNMNLEVVVAAFDQMLLFLDDMHKAERKDVESIIEIMNGEGRGRLTEARRASFCTSLLSTSNTSVIEIARDLGIKNQYEALIDRVIDLPRPAGCPYFFEGIHKPKELRAFGDSLRDLSRKNFG